MGPFHMGTRRDSLKRMRLSESRRVPLWNGPIECRLFRFDLVAGTARAPRPEAGAAALRGGREQAQSDTGEGVAEFFQQLAAH